MPHYVERTRTVLPSPLRPLIGVCFRWCWLLGEGDRLPFSLKAPRTADTALLSLTLQSSLFLTAFEFSFSAFLRSRSFILSSLRLPETQSQRQPSVGQAPSDKAVSANHVERQFVCPPCPQRAHQVQSVAGVGVQPSGTDGERSLSLHPAAVFSVAAGSEPSLLWPLPSLCFVFDFRFAVIGSKAEYLHQHIGQGACARLHDSHRILSLGLLIGDLQLRHNRPS